MTNLLSDRSNIASEWYTALGTSLHSIELNLSTSHFSKKNLTPPVPLKLRVPHAQRHRDLHTWRILKPTSRIVCICLYYQHYCLVLYILGTVQLTTAF